ncbi:glycosyltransferase [Candidatus Woesearchaeota archaeon]|nr:glycosyltransferase [Candidatus Woesearchaeota archaeon]MCF7901479.1 glycosyltransferase [Candidatus Woesearchaeota archaeon]MCF8013188.1 glycosyltransferase [Candidatus Woesearchaeota archaeon]
MKNSKVSVIFPLYGTFDISRAYVVIDAVLAQEDVNVEVVVSEQGPKSRFKPSSKKIKHIFNQHIPSEDLSNYNPGLIRNIGIKNSEGEFIYTNDSDILFTNPKYLSSLVNLMNEKPDLALFKPEMRRFPIQEFEMLHTMFEKEGIKHTIHSLIKTEEYITTISGRDYPIKIVTRPGRTYEKVYTAFIEKFQEYRSGDHLLGKEPLIFLENLHVGGNFFRRSQIDHVNGYCEDYINWGCEDSDLQWKIMHFFDLQRIPRGEDLDVLHLDHPKGYFNSEAWKKNEVRFKERREKGVEYCLAHDKKTW